MRTPHRRRTPVAAAAAVLFAVLCGAAPAGGAAHPAAQGATAAPAPASGSGPAPGSVRATVVDLVNGHRAAAGCPAVRPHAALRRAAERHSAHLARTEELSHRGPGGSGPADRAGAAGYEVRRVAENLAHDRYDAAAVVASWLESPGHRANLLDCAYRDIGLGLTRGPDGTWWTQLLGTERR